MDPVEEYFSRIPKTRKKDNWYAHQNMMLNEIVNPMDDDPIFNEVETMTVADVRMDIAARIITNFIRYVGFQNSHYHNYAGDTFVRCTDRDCVPCPGCGGVYDGLDYGGRGCSRQCAYSSD
jgi:hypothetical protein